MKGTSVIRISETEFTSRGTEIPVDEANISTRGKAIDVTWQKDSPWGVTHYITDDNQEVQLNPGTTWVEIVQDDRVDDISYQ